MMTRRSFILAIGCVVILGVTISTVLILLLRYEPEHFRNAPLPTGERRTQQSQEFLSEFSEFWNALSNNRSWDQQFTDSQINCYLNESFIHCGLSEKLLPEGISEPRVRFEPDRMRLAFRYRSRFVNTIVSVCLKIWLPRTESNTIAIQLRGLQAGLLPFSAQWLLEQISETGRLNGVEVNWYRHEGYPVALVRFQADQARPTLQIKAVQIKEGNLLIHGQTGDGAPANLVPMEPKGEGKKE